MQFHIQKADGRMREYPPLVGNTWAAFNALRNLGFFADDIHVVEHKCCEEHGAAIAIELRTQGREFTMVIARLDEGATADGFFAMWEEFAIDVARIPESVLANIYDAWLARVGNPTMLVTEIVMRGIKLPLRDKASPGSPSIVEVPRAASTSKPNPALN